MFNCHYKYKHYDILYVMLFFYIFLLTLHSHAENVGKTCSMLFSGEQHKSLLNYSQDIGGGEHVFIVRSSVIDPDLVAWLRIIKSQNQGIKDPLKITSKIVDQILNEVKMVEPDATTYFPNPQYIKLGQVLKFGGVCRHRALLLLTALEEVGIQANYGWGNVEITLDNGKIVASDFHAWVEVAHNGRRYMFDPTLREVPKAIDITASTEGYSFPVWVNNASEKIPGIMRITPFHFLHDMETNSQGEMIFTTSLINAKVPITENDLRVLLANKSK